MGSSITVAHGPRMLEAVRGGDIDSVASLLERHPSLARMQVAPDDGSADASPSGGTLLHVAVAQGHEAVARLLLEHGIDLEARNAEGRTALHDSLELGQREITRLLLSHGAYVDLCSAALLGDEARMRTLLEEDRDRVRDASTGLSPLGWASYGGSPDALSVLLEYGAELDPWDALFCAASCDHHRFVSAAIEAGADVNARCGPEQRTALHEAAQLRFTDHAESTVRVLLAAGADPHAVDSEGRTALDLARAAARAGSPRKQYGPVIALLEGAG